MTDIGPNTKITLSLQTIVSIVITVAMGVLLYANMATEDYVNSKVEKIQTEQSKQKDDQQKFNSKVDTAIELLSQSVENHDKNLEAFTRALERLRERD